jgi:hypothetical protein
LTRLLALRHARLAFAGYPALRQAREGISGGGRKHIPIAYISKYFTLKPGDIIFTGTPEGVIAGYPKEKQVWLKAGDKLTSAIEKLGELQFTLA